MVMGILTRAQNAHLGHLALVVRMILLFNRSWSVVMKLLRGGITSFKKVKVQLLRFVFVITAQLVIYIHI